jgi:hypothetical protein
MEAPKGRYSVVEKDGRLVVIDNATGTPATSSIPPPRSGRGERPGLSPAPIVPARGTIDAVADFLLALAVKEWDAEGKAVVAWEWKQNGKPKRWDARLDTTQQRRLGRALLSFAAGPLLILSVILLSGAAMWIALALTGVPVLWGMAAIGRLQSETAGQSGA